MLAALLRLVEEPEESEEEEEEVEDEEGLINDIKKMLVDHRKKGGSLLDRLKEVVTKHANKEEKRENRTTKQQRWGPAAKPKEEKRKEGKEEDGWQIAGPKRWKRQAERSTSRGREPLPKVEKVEKKNGCRRLQLIHEAGGYTRGEVVSYETLMGEIEANGELPKEAKVTVVNWQEAYNLREMAQVMGLENQFTMIIDPEKEKEVPEWAGGIKKTQMHEEFEKVGLQKVWHVPLVETKGIVPEKVTRRVHVVEE